MEELKKDEGMKSLEWLDGLRHRKGNNTIAEVRREMQ